MNILVILTFASIFTVWFRFTISPLLPSLVSRRFGQHRLQHRVLRISQSEIITIKARLEEELGEEKWANPVSGIDWSAMFRTTDQRYADHLEQQDLNSTGGLPNDILAKVFLQLRGMIPLYDLFSATRPANGSIEDRSWASPVYSACATAHSRRFISTKLTPSGTTYEKCSRNH